VRRKPSDYKGHRRCLLWSPKSATVSMLLSSRIVLSFLVISAGLDSVRGSFRSAKHALRLLSAGGNIKVRLVSVAEAGKGRGNAV
jgi:hypothetical protein